MTSAIVAHEGIVILDKAVWDTTWGQYAAFRLEQPPQLKESSNPFKRFTQMRKGKVGTIFAAVFTDVESGDVFYNDEVMLKGWSDGTTGWKVTFWFKGDGDHPFLGIEKDTEYAMVLVELDEDSSAINQEKRERVESAPKSRSEMKLSNYAAQLCRTPQFWGYLKAAHGIQMAAGVEEDGATRWMRNTLQIDSRSALDREEIVASKFHALIRRPYASWSSQR